MDRCLLDYALRNVWCNPEQDKQVVFAAQRITRGFGEIGTFRLMKRTFDLPTTGVRYQVYQIGNLHPGLIGMLYTGPNWVTEKWYNLAESISKSHLYSNVYTKNGVTVPRFQVYYMFTRDNDLVFAVVIDPKLGIDFAKEQLYFRLYTNSIIRSSDMVNGNSLLVCKGLIPVNTDEILAMQEEIRALQLLPGHVSMYCNGYKVNSISPISVTSGDTIEYLYDATVKKTIQLTIGDLLTFRSVKDSKYKYLIHYPVDGEHVIDYVDDIEIDIVAPVGNGVTRGLYYHRNNVDAHRMVTHRDYSIVIDYAAVIAKYLADNGGALVADSQTMILEIKIRNTGDHRPLVYDDSRIFELYKLPEEKILGAFAGVNSLVEFWKAENLENSAYCSLMSSLNENFSDSLVQSALGYNSMSKVVGDTPSRTQLQSSRKVAQLPRGLHKNATAYEYDVNGQLLGYYIHSDGTEYTAASNDCEYVEMINGAGRYRTGSIFGQNNLPLPTLSNYRVYMCHIYNGELDFKWTDITGSDLYTVVNNTLVWGTDELDRYLMVKSDGYFHAYDVPLKMVNGSFYFTLSEETIRAGKVVNSRMVVPPGEIDLFLNGHPLIRNVDYIVRFPMIHVINRDFIRQPSETAEQMIHVRCTGFCNSDMSMDVADDYGFIEHGLLSNNRRFDIRDDKVLRVIVNGALKTRDAFVFSELHSGVSITNALNGQPYQVRDVVIPMKDLSSENTYSLREKSLVKDKIVSDYMSVFLPQPERNAVSAIQRRYPIVSPFISRILSSLKSGFITEAQIERLLSDGEVIEICQPHEAWLKFDPIRFSPDPERKFTQVIPHFDSSVMTITVTQYRFLQRVVQIYSGGIVDISSFVNFDA